MSRSLLMSSLLALAMAPTGTTFVASSAAAAPEPLIQGVVVDQADRPVLGVKVQAIADDGSAAASDESYENVTAEGDPQPGYFALHVGDLGTYTVVLSKKGYFSETLEGVTLNRRGRIASLGEVELTRRPAATTTRAALKDAVVAPDERARVVVTVTADDGASPTGSVKVKDGRDALGSATLRAGDKGKVTITLPRLGRGSHDLKVFYGGADLLQPSTSKAFTLTVKKPNRERPNARDWLA